MFALPLQGNWRVPVPMPQCCCPCNRCPSRCTAWQGQMSEQLASAKSAVGPSLFIRTPTWALRLGMSTQETGPKAFGVQAASENRVMEKESSGFSRSRIPVSTWGVGEIEGETTAECSGMQIPIFLARFPRWGAVNARCVETCIHH